MRFRVTVTATAGAAALFLGLPGSAGAATGSFAYQYEYGGHTYTKSLENPEDRTCTALDLPDTLSAAYRAENRTDTTAIIFSDSGCETPARALGPGQSAPAKVLVRSIMFSG